MKACCTRTVMIARGVLLHAGGCGDGVDRCSGKAGSYTVDQQLTSEARDKQVKPRVQREQREQREQQQRQHIYIYIHNT